MPGYGNVRSAWDAGTRFDFEKPEYRTRTKCLPTPTWSAEDVIDW